MIRAGHVVLLCAIALLTLGVVMVSSAGMRVQPLGAGQDPVEAAAHSGVTFAAILTSRPAFYMGIALVAMFLASRLPVQRLLHAGTRPHTVEQPEPEPEPLSELEPTAQPRDLRPHTGLALGSLVLLAIVALVYMPGIANPVNGAHRWINLRLPGFQSVQPSEIAKWAIIPLIAWYAAALFKRQPKALGRFFTGLVPGLLAVGLVAALVVVEDLGTGFLIAVVGAFMLLAGGAKLRHFAVFVPLAVAGVVFAIMTSPYRVRRILAFLDPYADPMGDGFHMIQSMQTVAGAGPFGRGLGHGLQKFGYLPEDTTDFVFAIVCEELGLAGATLVIGLYVLMLWGGLHIARRDPRPLTKLITLGVVCTIAVQAGINLVVVTGLGPTKGIALPLLSHGGTGWILTSAMLGLLAAIDRTTPEPVLASTDAEFAADDSDASDDARPDSEFAPKPARRDSEPMLLPELKPRVRLHLTPQQNSA